jgi:hypothetical protein
MPVSSLPSSLSFPSSHSMNFPGWLAEMRRGRIYRLQVLLSSQSSPSKRLGRHSC